MAHSRSLVPDQQWSWQKPANCPGELLHVVSSLDQTREYISRAVRGLGSEALWHRPNPGIPSMGNILMHLRGTEHEWIGVKIGGLPRKRDRDLEFSAEGGKELPELLADLESTRAESDGVIAGLTGTDEEILFFLHYTENHFAFHAGQLCMLRKLHEPEFLLYE